MLDASRTLTLLDVEAASNDTHGRATLANVLPFELRDVSVSARGATPQPLARNTIASYCLLRSNRRAPPPPPLSPQAMAWADDSPDQWVAAEKGRLVAYTGLTGDQLSGCACVVVADGSGGEATHPRRSL